MASSTPSAARPRRPAPRSRMARLAKKPSRTRSTAPSEYCHLPLVLAAPLVMELNNGDTHSAARHSVAASAAAHRHAPPPTSRFNLENGQVEGKWCPGGIGFIVGKLVSAEGVPTYKVKKSGAFIQVEVDVAYKQNYESNYWRGILDAQGKTDGGYY
mmetsp:Transcript_42518/g.113458  ORF Transcript_42518/g.113458 Transcript_42518/m.113458 type:complete len:157 (-) Transcript_42518:305-775(-)